MTAFGDASVGALTFLVNDTVEETLPRATYGDSAVGYTLTPEELAGVRYPPPMD